MQQRLKSDANETRSYVRAYGKQTELLEQMMRKNNLVLFGVPMGKDEDLELSVIKIFQKEMQVNFTRADFELVKRIMVDSEK